MSEKSLQVLMAERCLDEAVLLAALDAHAGACGGVVEPAMAQPILLDELGDEGGFLYPRAVRLRAVELLPRHGAPEVLELVIGHLARVPFADADEDRVDRYMADLGESLGPIVRTFNYLDPDELVLDLANRVLGRPVALDDEVDRVTADRVTLLCELIMGGGFFPSFDRVATLRDVVARLERGL